MERPGAQADKTEFTMKTLLITTRLLWADLSRTIGDIIL